MIESGHTEWQIHCAFNAFCKQVLKHAAIDICNERRRQQSKERIFSDLTPQEAHQLYAIDHYREDDTEEFSTRRQKNYDIFTCRSKVQYGPFILFPTTL